MLIIKKTQTLRQTVTQWRQENKHIALIPTMGNLHTGHVKLMDTGRVRAENKVVVSVFVNPIQFDRTADLASYPRTLQQDYEQLTWHDVDMVFVPATSAIYPYGIVNQSFVDVPGFTKILEGANRPGHFRGVATVVSKLFNLMQPEVAYFGEKDFQQLAIIRQLVRHMGYDTDIIGVPTVRTADNLALSSRNSYLNAEAKLIVPQLYQALTQLVVVVPLRVGERHNDNVLAAAELLLHVGIIAKYVDYQKRCYHEAINSI
ncbi:pantoate--beta-alanine ligase [Candidatus Moranella endobia PCIT]|uniref:Pantothenate synthetase n=1 Tax=Moranella endobia (strain PCIT) TaxID=903503 RepID=F7XY05_MOREP|nr:pantoate--beta-alanine ligase [Candidatus Moranella endobia PCIT]